MVKAKVGYRLTKVNIEDVDVANVVVTIFL